MVAPYPDGCKCGHGLILAASVGKQRIHSSSNYFQCRRKNPCKQFNTDDWDGHERVLAPEIKPDIGKNKIQRLERTNGTVRKPTGRWHRQQNKFDQVWEQTKVTTQLIVSYFNWIRQYSQLKNTATLTTRINDAIMNLAWHCHLSQY